MTAGQVLDRIVGAMARDRGLQLIIIINFFCSHPVSVLCLVFSVCFTQHSCFDLCLAFCKSVLKARVKGYALMMQCPWRSEAGGGFSIGAAVTYSPKPACGCWGPNSVLCKNSKCFDPWAISQMPWLSQSLFRSKTYLIWSNKRSCIDHWEAHFHDYTIGQRQYGFKWIFSFWKCFVDNWGSITCLVVNIHSCNSKL